MSVKKKKIDSSKRYKFDLEKGAYVEKNIYRESRENPTAIIYCRVSDQKQVDEGDGLFSQEATCRRWAESKNIRILKVFSDSAITGAILDRKGLMDSIEYLKTENAQYPKVTYFLCTEISRISRSEQTEETGTMKKTIEKTGVEIITTYSGRNISSTNVSDSLITDIDIALAKNERLRIRERSMNGSKAKLYAGQRIFHPPVGYERIHVKNGTKTEKVLQMVEPQASIVKEGLELFADGVFLSNKQLLDFYNKNHLTSNFHSPNPGKLNLTFVRRMLEIERLYFYAGFVLYPNFGVMDPIEATHTPLITLSTVHKILNKLNIKGGAKNGPKKNSTDLYPLRGMVHCPYCNFPMTARASTGKMKEKYPYYGCNRKDCKEKECINANTLHDSFKNLLKQLTPRPGVLKLVDGLFQETLKEKNQRQSSINEAKRRRIKELSIEIDGMPNIISKLTRIEIIQGMEEKWAQLTTEKEILERDIQDDLFNEKEFILLYDRVRNIIQDPLSIWELGSTEFKILLVGVLFGGKFFYKKNEGFKTPHLSGLFGILSHLQGGMVSYGAGDETRTRNNLLGRQKL